MEMDEGGSKVFVGGQSYSLSQVFANKTGCATTPYPFVASYNSDFSLKRVLFRRFFDNTAFKSLLTVQMPWKSTTLQNSNTLLKESSDLYVALEGLTDTVNSHYIVQISASDGGI
mmetsp:Transcript_4652/g.7895  ORF Transcript_4652/g.7895 Transcript_4652/m.7895 type:complete len:115 (+) Transcript_4652:362-706(+)|eukprot:CAMPEP_0168608500 /NCGR_PEP_ID=MMETSP0449_2-20121227/659_1 /TAXON_ID=1082188 /ORGANISM="Strombidium rassoulzadegani, Strain ras09" /LENGTH=114 /DNA_ID=CAMNT_0008648487 /DNA_START=300 /DNA_END=644 /DNA_ORIENTATION=+